MSNRVLQLEGQIEDPDKELTALQDENDRLCDELRQARLELATARNNSVAALSAITNLRQTLNPLRRAILAIYGELDLVPEQAGPSPSPMPGAPPSNPRWESWKQKMPGKPAEFIDLLLLHGEMSVKQFMAATKCGQDTAYKTLSKLGQAGLVANAGGKYRLKEI